MDSYEDVKKHQVSAKTFSFVLTALIVLSFAFILTLWDRSKVDEEITALQRKVQEKDKQISALTVVAKRLESECANTAH